MTYLSSESLTSKLNIWIKKKRKEVFIIDGPSGVGKTTFIKNYMDRQIVAYMYIDIKQNKEVIERLLNDTYITPETFYSSLCFRFGRSMTLNLMTIIFDGIEYCPGLRQFFKTLVNYDRINIIAITCGGIGPSHYKNLLVPSEENINHLFPLTFVEFLESLGQKALSNHLFESILNQKPISEYLSSEIFQKYKLYNLIGGYPSVVEHYHTTKDIVSCMSMNRSILVRQFAHAEELLSDEDTKTMREVAKNIFTIVSSGTYNSLQTVSIYKMKQFLSFLEDEYVITMPTALDMKNPSKQSSSKRLYFFHQCFYHATDNPFKNEEYFNNHYPTEFEVLTDFFFNQRYNSRPYQYGIVRQGKYIETDALLLNNIGIYGVEFKTRRLSTDYNINIFKKTNGAVKPGILLFNGNVFEYGEVTVLPSYCSCFLNTYIDNVSERP